MMLEYVGLYPDELFFLVCVVGAVVLMETSQ